MTYTATERNKVVRAAYARRYDLMRLRGIPTSPVPARPVAEYMQRLYNLGWSYDALSQLTDEKVSNQAVRLIVIGEHETTYRTTRAALMAIPYTLAPTDRVPDTCKIPALGGMRRVQALLRLGWTHAEMHRRSGVDTTHVAAGTYRQMLTGKWRTIDRLYRELNMTPGPSRKTLIEARNLGYAPALAWRDIDDPDETPERNPHENRRDSGLVDRAVVSRLLAGERVPSTKAEKDAAMRRWRSAGKSERELCAVHGWRDGRYGREGLTA